jgi:hypothetical protein
VGVTSIIAPDEHGTFVEMTSKPDMELSIMTENETKDCQASFTPFIQEPLLHDFGYLGIGEHVNSVMQGSYTIPPNVDQYTAKFISQLQMDPAITNF